MSKQKTISLDKAIYDEWVALAWPEGTDETNVTQEIEQFILNEIEFQKELLRESSDEDWEDREYCDNPACQAELEVGRIGYCDECIEVYGKNSEYDD